MVAYAQQTAGQLRPMDTGVVFNGNVRVWLMCDDEMEAAACGATLNKLGLPRQMQLVQSPKVKGMFAVNPEVPPQYVPKFGRKVPTFLRYKQYPIILETADHMDLMRFYKWLHAKNPNTPKPAGPPSLKELADDGIIETIDAG